MSNAAFILGLALIAVALGAIAGLWWGVLGLGVELVAFAVLTEASPAEKKQSEQEADR